MARKIRFTGRVLDENGAPRADGAQINPVGHNTDMDFGYSGSNTIAANGTFDITFEVNDNVTEAGLQITQFRAGTGDDGNPIFTLGVLSKTRKAFLGGRATLNNPPHDEAFSPEVRAAVKADIMFPTGTVGGAAQLHALGDIRSYFAPPLQANVKWAVDPFDKLEARVGISAAHSIAFNVSKATETVLPGHVVRYEAPHVIPGYGLTRLMAGFARRTDKVLQVATYSLPLVSGTYDLQAYKPLQYTPPLPNPLDILDAAIAGQPYVVNLTITNLDPLPAPLPYTSRNDFWSWNGEEWATHHHTVTGTKEELFPLFLAIGEKLLESTSIDDLNLSLGNAGMMANPYGYMVAQAGYTGSGGPGAGKWSVFNGTSFVDVKPSLEQLPSAGGDLWTLRLNQWGQDWGSQWVFPQLGELDRFKAVWDNAFKTPEDREREFRKAGLSKRAADVVLAALNPPEPMSLRYDSATDRLILKSPVPLPDEGAVNWSHTDYSGETYLWGPDNWNPEGVLSADKKTVVWQESAGWVGTRQVTQFGWTDATSDPNRAAFTTGTEDDAPALTELLPYLPGGKGLKPDWNAVLRRGDLSPRQVKTLRGLSARATPANLEFAWNVPWVGVNQGKVVAYKVVGSPFVPTSPPNFTELDPPTITPTTDYAVTPAGGTGAVGQYVLFAKDYQGHYRNGLGIGRPDPIETWGWDPFAAVNQQPPFPMRSLLRGGFTRHQAKLILGSL